MIALFALSLALGADAAPPPELVAYEHVRVALVTDDLALAKAALPELLSTLQSDAAAQKAAGAIGGASDLPAARLAFGELSKALIANYATVGAPDGVHVYYCPMTTTFPYWLQTESGLKNPYMGTMMPICGEGVAFKAAAKAATSP